MSKRLASRSPEPPSRPVSSCSSLSALTLSDVDDIEDCIPQKVVPSPRRSKRRKVLHDTWTPSSDASAASSDEDDAAPLGPRKRKNKKTPTTSALKTAAKKEPTQRKKAVQKLEGPHPTPEHWHEVIDAITDMRAMQVAPVDTQECQLAQLLESEPKDKRLITLVSLILSPRTTDQVCDAAVRKLRTSLGGSVSLEALLAANYKTISTAICKVGMWQAKTGFLQKTAKKLRDDFGSDVPKTVKELCTLMGVGEKVAILTLQAAWGITAGICVDTHVERITNLLGWHHRPTSGPKETRLNIESWLPVEFWPKINPLLVGFGQVSLQTVCTPKKRLCGQCTLSSRGLCPSAAPEVVPTAKAEKIEGKRLPRAKARVEITVETPVLEAPVVA
ncbi:DNA glycosylase [Amylostereum chailletii]|nr:DNA glycosylase [Amylostereum chailletii]